MPLKNIVFFFERNPNPIWIYDPGNLRLLEVNDAALQLSGVNSYIVKPVAFNKFIDTISEVGFYWLLFIKNPKRTTISKIWDSMYSYWKITR